jgi:hypothetical protein
VSDGSVSAANCREGAETMLYRYKSPTCVSRRFADDMSHCPSKLINEKMHCSGLSFLHTSKLNNEEMHCSGPSFLPVFAS